jgi:hypothetical protein
MTSRNYDLPAPAAPDSAGDARLANSSPSSLTLLAGLVLICCFAATYLWCVLRVYQANRFAAGRDRASLERAIRLQPQDANSYDLLGQYFIWDADPEAAVSQFQQAARLNPYSATYWLHLAQAYSSAGADNEQAAAISKAIAVDPTTPEVAWNAANYYLLRGDTAEALDMLAVVIRNDPTMAETALDLSWRVSRDINAMVRRLPPDPNLYLQSIRLLLDRQQWSAAGQMWSGLLGLNRDFDPNDALFYVDALLAKSDAAGARDAWQSLVRASSGLQSYLRPGNLVVNPGFNHKILNAGFDWRYRPLPGVSLLLDSTQSYQGTESLLVTYSGPSQDAGMFQYVPVTPGTSYVASSWVKSEELQSANGPRLTVSNPYNDLEYAHSEETLGTTSWHQVEAAFTALPGVDLVSIRFSRQPGDTWIQGRFWIGYVELSQK